MKNKVLIVTYLLAPLVLLGAWYATGQLQWQYNFPRWLDTLNFVAFAAAALGFLILWPLALYTISRTVQRRPIKFISLSAIAIAMMVFLALLLSSFAWN